MKIIDFVILVLICGICGFIIWKQISQKKRGKNGTCNGNCAGCTSFCHKKSNNK